MKLWAKQFFLSADVNPNKNANKVEGAILAKIEKSERTMENTSLRELIE
jgi:hypothetical protein